MTIAIVTNEQGTENMEYAYSPLRRRQPGFSAALQLAVDMMRHWSKG
jgi:hypothetical protein